MDFIYFLGHLSVWALARIFEAARHFLLQKHGHLDFPMIYKDNTTFFIVAEIFEFTQKIHTNIRKLEPFPTSFTVSAFHIGSSSITLLVNMTNSKTHEWLGRNKVKIVAADRNTHRSIKLPEWYQDKYGHIQAELAHRLEKQTRPDTPPNHFTRTETVRYSDLDHQGHVNHAHYIRFLMDCATEASFSGRLSSFRGDLCSYAVQKVQIEYLGESGFNDELLISLWENLNNTTYLHFSIEKKGQRIVYAEISFHL